MCAVLSGGNVDASLLYECIPLGETAAGRRMVLSTIVPDRPGALAWLLHVVAEHGGSVVDVEHLRDGIDLHVGETAIQPRADARPEAARRSSTRSASKASRCAWSARPSLSGVGLPQALPAPAVVDLALRERRPRSARFGAERDALDRARGGARR